MRPLLIVPAYNEEESISNVVDSIMKAGYDYVVVNDGSTDNTARICRREKYNLLNLSRNLGIGGAVQAGHLYALEHDYDVDIQFDGDGQHDVDCVSTLLECIEAGNDLVIGSRFVSPSEGFKSTAVRRAGIKWLQSMISLRAGVVVTDATSGFRACSRRAIELFADNYPQDYPEPESIALAANYGLKIAEVPVTMHERQGGTSSIGPLSAVYYMIKVTLAVLMAGGRSAK